MKGVREEEMLLAAMEGGWGFGRELHSIYNSGVVSNVA